MFGGTLLEVAIGLVFVYLLLSLICSVVNEWIAALFSRRPRNLRDGVNYLLSDGAGKSDAMVVAFFDHPLIKSLTYGDKRTSYIPAERFALTLLDLLAPANGQGSMSIAQLRAAVNDLPPDHPLQRVLLPLIEQTGGDLKKLQAALQDWYNECMDRLTGVYKRWNTLILVALASTFAILLNADSLMVVHVLSQDRALRQSVVAAAESYAKEHPAGAAPKSSTRADTNGAVGTSGLEAKPNDGGASQPSLADRIREIKQPLDRLGLPFGWRWADEKYADKDDDPTSTPWKGKHVFWWFWKILGLFMTAAAVSLGAPFWFDVLNRFMNVRSSIKTDDDTDNKAVRRKDKPPASVTGTGGVGSPAASGGHAIVQPGQS